MSIFLCFGILSVVCVISTGRSLSASVDTKWRFPVWWWWETWPSSIQSSSPTRKPSPNCRTSKKTTNCSATALYHRYKGHGDRPIIDIHCICTQVRILSILCNGEHNYSFGNRFQLDSLLSLLDSEVCAVLHWTQHHGHAHNADQQTPRCWYFTNKHSLPSDFSIKNVLIAAKLQLWMHLRFFCKKKPKTKQCCIDFSFSQAKRHLGTQCTRTCTTSPSVQQTRSSVPGPPWRRWTGRTAAWLSSQEPTPAPCRSTITQPGRYNRSTNWTHRTTASLKWRPVFASHNH